MDDFRSFAIGDIHGCFKTFQKLMEECIVLRQSDQIYLLGDYIDRGPSSAKVLDYIFDLKESGFKIRAIKGNHEQMFTDTYRCGSEFLLNYATRYKCLDLLNYHRTELYIDFFESLEYFIETPDYYLVHAGFNFKADNPFTDYRRMILSMNPRYDEQVLKGKKLIHGHFPQTLSKIKENINTNSGIIGLDNGCVFCGFR